jgi:hypothetical protein
MHPAEQPPAEKRLGSGLYLRGVSSASKTRGRSPSVPNGESKSDRENSMRSLRRRIKSQLQTRTQLTAKRKRFNGDVKDIVDKVTKRVQLGRIITWIRWSHTFSWHCLRYLEVHTYKPYSKSIRVRRLGARQVSYWTPAPFDNSACPVDLKSMCLRLAGGASWSCFTYYPTQLDCLRKASVKLNIHYQR